MQRLCEVYCQLKIKNSSTQNKICCTDTIHFTDIFSNNVEVVITERSIKGFISGGTCRAPMLVRPAEEFLSCTRV